MSTLEPGQIYFIPDKNVKVLVSRIKGGSCHLSLISPEDHPFVQYDLCVISNTNQKEIVQCWNTKNLPLTTLNNAELIETLPVLEMETVLSVIDAFYDDILPSKEILPRCGEIFLGGKHDDPHWDYLNKWIHVLDPQT